MSSNNPAIKKKKGQLSTNFQTVNFLLFFFQILLLFYLRIVNFIFTPKNTNFEKLDVILNYITNKAHPNLSNNKIYYHYNYRLTELLQPQTLYSMQNNTLSFYFISLNISKIQNITRRTSYILVKFEDLGKDLFG